MQFVEERKRKLDGRIFRYCCQALEVQPMRAVLLYRMERALDLGGLCIPADAVSYGIYWTGRPYNVYKWVNRHGETLAYYCNAATETRIGDDAVDWLDLEADVLITPDGHVRVLDLDEVPTDLSGEHRRALEAALVALKDAPLVVAEVEACTRRFGWSPAREPPVNHG